VELFIVVCIAVVAWLLYGSRAQPSPSASGGGAGGDGAGAGNAAVNQAWLDNLSQVESWALTYNQADDPNAVGIPPVLGPVRNN
jgi:hypothetical protein